MMYFFVLIPDGARIVPKQQTAVMLFNEEITCFNDFELRKNTVLILFNCLRDHLQWWIIALQRAGNLIMRANDRAP